MSADKDHENRVSFSTSIDFRLSEQLKDLSERSKIPMSRLIDRGIELVLQEYDGDTEQPTD
ncbi:ribbon-helix-helix domain-containing protein [Parasporobacterium paucivorans]|uniref:Ribbon-helix-helix domain-containing protein n=1 Tax=Parasporobacterium paucivorans DSM 15970 TaxID=1122934 RepID=A0A1M6DIR4_9FIRM|nr:ribbon-helix-helix domain-containing protein [Parasporobacterium paucivorans]SHI73013.1 Ribbon-helix-helix domain-containing protein [Parasporobacterium paucivorans DSM 15970]